MKKELLLKLKLRFKLGLQVLLLLFSCFYTIPVSLAQENDLIFSDYFNRDSLGEDWQASASWSILDGTAYNYIDGTGGTLKTTKNFTATSYIIETAARGFSNSYYREFRITFGQEELAEDRMYVLSYKPYEGGPLTLGRATDNVYYPKPLDEAIIYPNLDSVKWYKFKIEKYSSGLIQVYLDKGAGYSTVPLLEAIDSSYTQLGHVGWQQDIQTAPEGFYVDWIVVRQPTTEKPAIKEKPVEDNLISQVLATSGRTYNVAKLNVGEKHYTDRDYIITSVPDYLQGASFIQTANDDKYDTSRTFLTTFMKRAVILYVGYDPRGTTLPEWLKSWHKTGDIIGTNDPGIDHLDIYSKLSYEHGPIYPNPTFFGGNLADTAAGAKTNYLVAAIEIPEQLRLEAEEAQLAGPQIATNHLGYSGTGFVDYLNPVDDYIEWTVQIDVPGTYKLGLNFSNGRETSRSLLVTVNGNNLGDYPFSSTMSWDTWAFLSGPPVYLTKGTHKVRTTALGESGPNVDFLSLYYSSATPPAANALAGTNTDLKNARSTRNGPQQVRNVSPLASAYPNPFTNGTTINYTLNEKKPVRLAVYSIQGARLQVLVDEVQAPGNYQVKFNGSGLQRGLYIYQLKTGNNLQVGKLLKE